MNRIPIIFFSVLTLSMASSGVMAQSFPGNQISNDPVAIDLSRPPYGPKPEARIVSKLIAFKVTRQENDGSVIILWKQLKKYKTPTLN